MQSFTKIEISWITIELEKQAACMKQASEKHAQRKEKALSEVYQLRSEQYASISQRLRLALEEGDKRIKIK